MASSGRDGLEPEIIISTLQHTNLPTLLVEGSGDVLIYRWLEDLLGVGRVDILQCGGRNDLFEIYSRKEEFSGKPVVFLADLDSFLYFGINIEYRDIIFTSGYSIENDILNGRSIHYLFDASEIGDYTVALNRMIEIYSDKIVRRGQNNSEDMAIHPVTYYDFDRSIFKSIDPFSSYSANQSWYDHISKNPQLLVRGKNMINLYTGILSRRSRKSKYSKDNIIELHLKSGKMPMGMARIVVKIRNKFKEMGIAG